MGPSRYNHLSSFCQVGGDEALFLWLCLSFFRACDKVERNHTGNACICLLCSFGVCGDSLWESWVRPLGLRSDGGCCPFLGAAFPFGCLFVFVRKLSGD